MHCPLAPQFNINVTCRHQTGDERTSSPDCCLLSWFFFSFMEPRGIILLHQHYTCFVIGGSVCFSGPSTICVVCIGLTDSACLFFIHFFSILCECCLRCAWHRYHACITAQVTRPGCQRRVGHVSLLLNEYGPVKSMLSMFHHCFYHPVILTATSTAHQESSCLPQLAVVELEELILTCVNSCP